MKTSRWLSIFLVTVMVLAMATSAFAGVTVTPGDPDLVMYANDFEVGDIVAANFDPYSASTQVSRLNPTNALGPFDATAPTGVSDYFFATNARTWSHFTFEGKFMNVDGAPDIEFAEVTWGYGSSWHTEAVLVYLTGAYIRNSEGNVVPYGASDDGIGYYAGIAWNRIGLENISPASIRLAVTDSYFSGTRDFADNEFYRSGDYETYTQFHLPEEVVYAEGIHLIDITKDVYGLGGNGSFMDVSGTGALVTLNGTAWDVINYDKITAANVTAISGLNGNTDGYDLDAIRVYKYTPPPELYKLCGYKLDADTGEGLEGWEIILRDVTGTEQATTTTDADGRYCFMNLPAGTYTVEEVLTGDWEQTFPEGDGKYEVTLPNVDVGANLIENGDFEAGNTGFTSGYTFIEEASHAHTDSLYVEGTYGVGTDPADYHELWESYGDNTSGFGNMMIVNGVEYTPDMIVWSDSVEVDADTNYTFSFWGATSYPAAYSTLDVYINEVKIGTYNAPDVVAEWTKFETTWNSKTDEEAVIKLICNTLIHTGNDFALDDFSLTGPPSYNFENRTTLGDVPAFKFYDANVNGVFDEGDKPIEGWMIKIFDGDTEVGSKLTDANGEVMFTVPYGDYTIKEIMPMEKSWIATTSMEKDVTVARAEIADRVEFGNVCIGEGGGKTLGFWSNKNGQKLFEGTDKGASSLAMLGALNLRNADGSDFDPTSYLQFRTWLLAGNATNMSYMLSVQLSAMELNVTKGSVNGETLIYVPKLTDIADEFGFASVNAVMGAADVELGLHGTALSGNEWRAYQGDLKDALDYANNNLNFLQAGPCKITY